jgi:hypothetical protein
MRGVNAEDMMSRAQRTFGAPLGETFTALIQLAAEIRPDDPPNAFDPLWFRLLDPEHLDIEEQNRFAPPNVGLFAWTGGDGNCFGFLLDDPSPAVDERRIVKLYPMDDASSYEVVAPNLPELLGLLAVAFGEVVTRKATDEEWRQFRVEWYGSEPDLLSEMDALSKKRHFHWGDISVSTASASSGRRWSGS